MRPLPLRFIVSLLLSWLAVVASAHASPLVVRDMGSQTLPYHHLAIMRDASSTLSFEEVLTPAVQEQFAPGQGDARSFGISGDAWWFRGDLLNDTDSPVTRFLEVTDFKIPSLDLYLQQADGHWTHQRGGSQQVVAGAEALRRLHHTFRLDLGPHQRMTFYLRAQSEYAVLVPMQLHTTDSLMRADRLAMAAYGVCYGIMLAMIVYNVFIWAILRETTYLYYLGFLATITLNALFHNGIVATWWLDDTPRLVARLWMASYSVFGVFIVLFGVAFLRLDTRLSDTRTLVYGLIGLCILSGTLSLTDYSHAAMMATTVTGLAIDLCILGWALRSVRSGSEAARYFLAAWLVFIAGIGLFAMVGNGWMSYDAVALHAMQAGAALGALLLSIALAARMKQLMAEREAAQQGLVQQEKMASLGMLSAGVAHDINNPNNFARLSAQTLGQQVTDTQGFILELLEDAGEEADDVRGELARRFDSMKEQVGLIDEGTRRIADIVHGMRASARNDAGVKETLNPVEALQGTLTLVMSTYRHTVTPVTELDAQTTIEGHRSRINQLFMNLLINACQAIEERQTQLADKTPGTLTLRSSLDAHSLVIRITDTGCGMSDDTLRKLFTPFFTTKGLERGTGLGMSICQRIMQEHDGRLEVTSTPGVGTTITLVFPCLQGATAG